MGATATLPYFDAMTTQMLHEEIDTARAWKRHTLSPDDWLVALPEDCLAELDAVIRLLRLHPQPVSQLTPTGLALSACARVMTQIRHKLQQQIGLAIIDRLPVERYSPDENTAIGWLLANLMGPVVAQKWDGSRLYHVRDSGQPLGYGVRRSVTNLEQAFHTDGGWVWMPPAAIGLFCIQQAQQGGINRCVSLLTVHNELRQRHPDLLARLYQPFWWDRQAEHAPGDPKFCAHPVYQYDGHTLSTRYYEDYISNGYRLAGEPLDTAGRAALAAMRATVEAPENWVDFRLEMGQFLYVNNRQLAHARTAFQNAPGADTHRHLLRLWNREEGSLNLEGHAQF